VSAAAAARTEEQRFEYKRREPQSQVLHRLVREHLEPFLAYTRGRYRKPLPKYVERELRGLLRCGDPWHGFTRVRCPRCRHEFFVAFSCGARTVCPSCAGRRMAAASVHLTDRVLPDAPVRQYVLSAPYELRLLLASRSEVLSAVMNCHTHPHVIVIDGVYSRQDVGTTRFHFVEPPSAQELASLVATICERVCRMLRRRGLMGEASHDSNEVRLPEAAIDGCRTVAMSRRRFEPDPGGDRGDVDDRRPRSRKIPPKPGRASARAADGSQPSANRAIRTPARPRHPTRDVLRPEPVPSWARGLDPDPDERGPPTDWEFVDPPAPET